MRSGYGASRASRRQSARICCVDRLADSPTFLPRDPYTPSPPATVGAPWLRARSISGQTKCPRLHGLGPGPSGPLSGVNRPTCSHAIRLSALVRSHSQPSSPIEPTRGFALTHVFPLCGHVDNTLGWELRLDHSCATYGPSGPLSDWSEFASLQRHAVHAVGLCACITPAGHLW